MCLWMYFSGVSVDVSTAHAFYRLRIHVKRALQVVKTTFRRLFSVLCSWTSFILRKDGWSRKQQENNTYKKSIKSINSLQIRNHLQV
jgi:predicted small secreted protein